MATVQAAIIEPALISLGYIRAGATPTAAILANALVMLQQLMTSWSAEQPMAYVNYHQIFPSGAGGVVAGTATYTLGTGGTMVATARPIRITSAVSASGNQRIPVQIMSWDQFNAEVQDELSSRSVFCKKLAADQSFPAINIRLWPMPDTSPATLELDYYSPLPAYTLVGDTVTLPEGWEVALSFNLAVILYGQYSRPGGATLEWLASQASNFKNAIAQKNAAILGLTPAAA